MSTPRISVTGRELPTARFVSAYNHRDFGYHDHAVTVFLPAWGQLMDHDMTMGAETKGNQMSWYFYFASYKYREAFLLATLFTF